MKAQFYEQNRSSRKRNRLDKHDKRKPKQSNFLTKTASGKEFRFYNQSTPITITGKKNWEYFA